MSRRHFIASQQVGRNRGTVATRRRRSDEPEERQKRARAGKGTDEEEKAKRRSAGERLPVPSADLSPLARPMATTAFGLVVVTEVTGELVDPEEIAEYQPW